MSKTTNHARAKRSPRSDRRSSKARKLPVETGVPDCAAETQLIADYLSGSLSPHLERSFEQHLSSCRDCTAFLGTYKKTIALTRSFLGQQTAAPKLRFAELRAAALRD